eukprot:2357047-Rhodomonas_salina.1
MSWRSRVMDRTAIEAGKGDKDILMENLERVRKELERSKMKIQSLHQELALRQLDAKPNMRRAVDRKKRGKAALPVTDFVDQRPFDAAPSVSSPPELAQAIQVCVASPPCRCGRFHSENRLELVGPAGGSSI